MRLLILNYEYPPLGGGAGVCAQYHARGLERLGYRVTVITAWFSGELEQTTTGNLTIIRLKSLRKKKYGSNPLEMLSWVFHAYRHITRNRLYEKTDMVMAHFSIPGGLVALPLKILRKVPYMIISHGQDIPWFCPRELFIYHLIFYLPIRLICRQAELITVLSERRLADARKLLGKRHEHKLHVVPNGCDTDFFGPAAAPLDSKIPGFLLVGRLTHQKGPFAILQTMGILHQKTMPFRLTVIGNGPLKKSMMRFVKDHGLEHHVDFTGWITKEELRDFYRQSNIMLVGSSDEGMSLAILEAMSAGMYIITTRVSGTEKAIMEGINGDYVRMNDPESMAEALEIYYREKFLTGYRVPEPILLKVRKDLSWDRVVETYNRLLK